MDGIRCVRLAPRLIDIVVAANAQAAALIACRKWLRITIPCDRRVTVGALHLRLLTTGHPCMGTLAP
jgi:hypothetical protein